MTCDTVWCVTWHFTGQYDLRCYIKDFMMQPPSNTNLNYLTLGWHNDSMDCTNTDNTKYFSYPKLPVILIVW